MQRIKAGAAICAVCRQAVRPDEDVVITPDFIADETDRLWRFTDAVVHRPCFLVWDQRKKFIAQYNRVARRIAADDGSYPHMTSEGEIVQRPGARFTRRGPAA